MEFSVRVDTLDQDPPTVFWGLEYRNPLSPAKIFRSFEVKTADAIHCQGPRVTTTSVVPCGVGSNFEGTFGCPGLECTGDSSKPKP